MRGREGKVRGGREGEGRGGKIALLQEEEEKSAPMV